MRFWDSSAIVPLCLTEPTSKQIRKILREDEDIVVWWATRIECLSAFERRRREGILHAEAAWNAKKVIVSLAAGWSEVLPSELVRRRAERLLATHALRAADALQLAAALVWAEEAPEALDVISFDQNLREGALKEGFTVFP
jgi:predicted nucleic acid-binding protein